MTDQPTGQAGRMWRMLRASARDLVLLVLGILIAFGLQASWDAHKERREDTEQLASLAAEFEAVIQVLEAEEAHLSGHLEATRALIELFGTETVPDAEELLAATRPAVGSRTIQVPSGVISQFFAESTLSRIDDPELRNLLGSWPALLDDTAEQLVWLRTHRDEVFTPALNEYLPARSLNDDFLELGPSPFAVRGADFLASRSMEGMLVYRLTIGQAGLEELANLIQAARRIQALLRTVTE